MKTDAYIRVICDKCGREEEVELTATARGWDERGAVGELEGFGWKITEEDDDQCPDCLEDK